MTIDAPEVSLSIGKGEYLLTLTAYFSLAMVDSALKWLARRLGISKKDVEENFEARLRLQKAVFFLKFMKIEPFTNYSFDLYLRGPYSPALADEYYELPDDEAQGDYSLLPDVDSLLSWFMDHDIDWLEVATSILSLWSKGVREADEIYDVLKLSKPWVSEGYFSGVLGELRARGILR
jgi:uncharacterized protein YwgA